jgi:hypothetical protein
LAIQRRPRTRCHLRCEIVQGKTRTDATVVTLSEGGLAVRTDLALAEGDDARIRLLPEQGSRSITVRALVWNTTGRNARRTVGFVVSDPPPGFLHLLQQSTGGPSRSEPRPARAASPRKTAPLEVVREAPIDPTLPRPRDPLPPPKPDPLEALPLFRVRVKQVGGPRSRAIEIRARSRQDCALWIRGNLEGEWVILEATRIERPGRP